METPCPSVGPFQEDVELEDSPQGTVEEAPLHMEASRAQLSRRLSNRPSVDDLLTQGIMFDFDVSDPCDADTIKKSRRADTSGRLQMKIQQRPDRQTLIDQHILPPSASGVSPKLQEVQEQLKKHQLIDSLNTKLEHRPGPMELVQKGVLPINMAADSHVKDGSIPFTPVAEAPAKKRQMKPKKPARTEKFGSLVFHKFVPPGGAANECREEQQALYLHLKEDQNKLMTQLMNEIRGPGSAETALKTAAASSRGLEQLTLSQLKQECRDRQLRVSGTKEQLARSLDPFREAIAEKYKLTLPRPSVDLDEASSSSSRMQTSFSSPNLARPQTEQPPLQTSCSSTPLQQPQQQQPPAYFILKPFIVNPAPTFQPIYQASPVHQNFPSRTSSSEGYPNLSSSDSRSWMDDVYTSPQNGCIDDLLSQPFSPMQVTGDSCLGALADFLPSPGGLNPLPAGDSVTSELLTPKTREFVFRNALPSDMEVDSVFD